jgi:hypothetical protein
MKEDKDEILKFNKHTVKLREERSLWNQEMLVIWKKRNGRQQ